MANILLGLVFVCFLLQRTLSQVSIDGPSVVNAHVKENTAIDTQVVDFHATEDNGGNITWSLSSYNNFSINSEGVVTVTGNLDREAIPAPHSVSLTVIATSGTNSASVTLTINILDENDNAPIFENPTANGTHDTITLEETEPVGSIVYTILASDPDYSSGGNFHFVFINPDGYFLVGYLTGDIELHKALDYETNQQHTLVIHIQDEGVPSLTSTATIIVNVTNQMETACVFGQKFYYASIPEGVYSPLSPSTLTTVSATDSNSSPNVVIKYALTTNPSGLFSIGITTGIVSLAGTLDRETTSRYIVPIWAQEYLAGGLVVADSPPCNATVVLTVTDINDNAPQFYAGTYTGFVDENVEEGHVVIATVDAFDVDQGSNAVFSYKIRDRAIGADNKFQINPTTGVINVTGDLDYESGNIDYEFIIEAAEPPDLTNPKTGTATVTIHIEDTNDNAPYFLATNYSYTIYEEQPITVFTPLIRAEDNDAQLNVLTFTINGLGTQTPYKHFQLTSPFTNQAQLSTLTALDRESIDSYHMIVTVRDNGPIPLSNTADVFVTVLDVNDHPPVFDVSGYFLDLVEETTYSSCLTVNAEDLMDEPGPNTDISYSLTVHSASPNTTLVGLQNTFILNGGSGQLICLPIDHESGYHMITLKVTAFDQGTNPGPLNASVYINITVEDINEHPPIFDQPSYNTTIYENHVVGTTIGVTVHATETGDGGLSHLLTYSIVSGNTNGAFSVDETSGVFTLAHSVDWETLSPNPIVVIVKASDRPDQGGNIHSSTATVTVYVLDVNEHSPYIIAPLGHPTYTVSEGDLPKVITTISATDPDGMSDGTVIYDFIHPLYGNFSMNPAVGVLYMNVPPDREAVPSDTFQITLIAKDQPLNASLAKTNSTYINIVVTDINDHPPIFDNTSLSISIPENTGGAVSLLTFHAEDNMDIGVNSEVEYFIQSISPAVFHPGGQVKFQIDQTTGVLQTGPLGFDYEDSTDRLYTVIIVARDKGTNPMQQTDTATATITITDVNDNPPVLVGSFFDHSIQENYGTTLTANDITLITGINATDIDSTDFTYSIVDPLKTKGLFSINENTGDIYIPSGTHVDREDNNLLVDAFGRAIVTFEIQVSDGLFTDEAEVTIYITDINDHPPVFSTNIINTGVPENVPIGTVVEIVSATDADYGSNAVITYNKTSGDPDGLFSILDPTVGKITVSGILDIELVLSNPVTFIVTAYDGLHSDSVQISVEITDTNDNSPIFNPTFYQVTIPEVTVLNELLEIVNATDQDAGTNGEITYAIVGGNINNAFYIKTATLGDVRVFNASAIDRETLSLYRLIITATDGAFPAAYQRTAVSELVIHISDVNDNTPQFLHFIHKGTVPENVPNNTFIAVTPSVYATDRDIGSNAVIIYDIEAGHPFRIDSNTGFIYSSNVGVLDREIQDFYNLTVHARDGGGRETTGLLQVIVTDVNDNSPIINEDPLNLDKTIAEDDSVGSLVAQITASDKDIGVNKQLLFSLTGGEGFFQVDANNGNVTLAQSLLSFERRTDFILTVRVNDGGIPSLSDHVSFRVSVTDINDNAPIFTHTPATFTKPEDTQPNVILALDPGLWTPGVVTDADDGTNAQYDFYLASDSSPVFDFDNKTGILRLVEELDYENQTLHTASIYVKDRGTPSLQAQQTLSIRLTVTDVNDQPPIFAQHHYAANVSELTESNVPVLLVSATDADTAPYAKITFHITSAVPGQGDDLFKIDLNSGLVLTKILLDESTVGCYLLYIEARNPDAPLLNDNATVQICVTEQFGINPHFSLASYNFTVVENQPAGYINTISIEDPPIGQGANSVITFTLITDPSDVGLFKINSTTGDLFTLQPLDREDKDLHILTVVAKDMGQFIVQNTNFTTILINVLDENDNSPRLLHNTFDMQYTISEGIARNTTITTIQATDVDLYPNNQIIFRVINDPKTLFKIDHETGLLQTEGGPNDFDREAFTNYTITIWAYNPDAQSRNDTANITFFLTDENDNAPSFTSTPNNTCIYENSPIGLLIGTFKATDADIGINSKVFYQIIGGNTGEAFSIEALNGTLKVLNQIDYDNGLHNYTLTIEVQDLGTPRHSATTQITICILDRNDNGPNFVNPYPVPVELKEHTTNDYAIASFDTTDLDDPPYDTAILQLISGNDEGAFYFNGTTRTIYVYNSSLLDYESGPLTYTLTVEAMDAGNNALTDTASITITISDINDNAPILFKHTFNITLLESETVGTILEQVNGEDADTGINAKLTYIITDGNGDDKFKINSTTGILSLSNSLDYETLPNDYILTVTVRDGGNPQLSDEAQIYIDVEDVNDNAPYFTAPVGNTMTLVIKENATVGQSVYTVQASDIDSGSSGEVTYEFSNSLLEFGTPPVFRINKTSGLIILIGSLDRETQISYEFTVIAKDHGIPQFQESVHFSINVADVNDHRPVFVTKSLQTYDVYEDSNTGLAGTFAVLSGTDIDIIDVENNNFYYYAVIDDPIDSTKSYVSDSECAFIFCVEKVTGKVYHHRYLDRETEAFLTFKVTISNFQILPTNVTIQSMGLDILTLFVRVLDVNDNAPQFLDFNTNVAVADDESVGTRILTVLTTDADTGNYQKVWYRFLTAEGASVVINKETGVITTAGPFTGEADRNYSLIVEAYDNEGLNPSLNNHISIALCVYNYLNNAVIIKVNYTINYVETNIEQYINILEDILCKSVLITNIRAGTDRDGRVNNSKTDIIFIVTDEGSCKLLKGSDVILLIKSNVTLDLPGDFIVPPTPFITQEGYPLWVILLITIGLGAIIILLCCAFCAFLINEKRRNRILKESRSEINNDAFSMTKTSSEFNTTTNPLWIAPVLIDDDSSSISTVNTGRPVVERRNPMYEDQEVNLELFDEDDDTPPLGSTENLIRPPPSSSTLRGISMTEDDLLDQAVGLIPMGSQDWEDDEDDHFSFI